MYLDTHLQASLYGKLWLTWHLKLQNDICYLKCEYCFHRAYGKHCRMVRNGESNQFTITQLSPAPSIAPCLCKDFLRYDLNK